MKYLRNENIILNSWLFLLLLFCRHWNQFFELFNFTTNPYLFLIYCYDTKTYSYPNHVFCSYRDMLLWLFIVIQFRGIVEWKPHLWWQESFLSNILISNICQYESFFFNENWDHIIFLMWIPKKLILKKFILLFLNLTTSSFSFIIAFYKNWVQINMSLNSLFMLI